MSLFDGVGAENHDSFDGYHDGSALALMPWPDVLGSKTAQTSMQHMVARPGGSPLSVLRTARIPPGPRKHEHLLLLAIVGFPHFLYGSIHINTYQYPS